MWQLVSGNTTGNRKTVEFCLIFWYTVVKLLMNAFSALTLLVYVAGRASGL